MVKYATDRSSVLPMAREEARKYDLEERTERFARGIRGLVREIKMTISNMEDAKQVIRSSGSVAGNYIEANDALSKKDFVMRIRICKKEAKESGMWLRLLLIESPLADVRDQLVQEATELTYIFGAILRKCTTP